MLGTRRFSPGSAAACMAMAVMAMACNPDSATTGPSGLNGKDFASNLRLIAGDQQIGAIGGALTQPLIVRVVDAGGQPVAGATVVFNVRQGGGSINPAANVSGTDGTVTATWTMGTSLGPNKAVALLSNQFLLDSAVFTATATTGPPQRFLKVGGDSQTGPASQDLPIALTVKVQDNFGNHLSGVKITWTPSALSGSASFVTDTTDAGGLASATWRLGTLVGTQNLTATVTGFATPIVFTAFATPDTGRRLTLLSGNGQTAGISTPLPVTIRVRVTDQHLNAVSGELVTWANTLTGGGSFNPSASVTNAAGEATSTWTLGSHPGLQTDTIRSASGGKIALTATATLQFWDVKAGNFQTCGIATINDRVYCWGMNDVGQIGRGIVGNLSVPSTPVATAADTINGPFPSFRQIASGRSLFCGITPARALYCWGRLITGATATLATLQTITSGGSQATANFITVGEEHMCHTSLPGQPFCTGVGESGQIGNGSFASTGAGSWAALSTVPAGQLFATISAGSSHTCGIPRYDGTAASQRPLCWGQNNAGQVGDGTVVSKSVPTAITLPPGVTTFDSVSVTAGGAHSCAFTADGTGVAYCWGSNGFGQLGIGAADNTPHSTATIVAGGLAFAALSAGEYHTCGITTTGDAYCWGRNDYGQLGSGSRTLTAPSGIAAPVAVTGGLKFRSITVGELHTCAVAATLGTPVGPSSSPGAIYCWGDNVFGQIGNGSSGNNNPVLTPTRVVFQP
jgi:alpha-tubulin suppressor-like RCC1 family protein